MEGHPPLASETLTPPEYARFLLHRHLLLCHRVGRALDAEEAAAAARKRGGAGRPGPETAAAALPSIRLDGDEVSDDRDDTEEQAREAKKGIDDEIKDLKEKTDPYEKLKSERDELQERLNKDPDNQDLLDELKDKEDALKKGRADYERAKEEQAAKQVVSDALQDKLDSIAKEDGRGILDKMMDDIKDKLDKNKWNLVKYIMGALGLFLLVNAILSQLGAPHGCKAVHYDKLKPGTVLQNDDFYFVDKDEKHFLASTTSKGGAGVSRPDACTGYACNYCMFKRSTNEDANITEPSLAVTSPMVMSQYGLPPPVTCPTSPPDSSYWSNWQTEMGKTPSYLGPCTTTVHDDTCVNTGLDATVKPQGTAQPGVVTPTNQTLADNAQFNKILGATKPDDMIISDWNTIRELQAKRLYRENQYACNNYITQYYCDFDKQNKMCENAETCQECLNGGLQYVCEWVSPPEGKSAIIRQCTDCDKSATSAPAKGSTGPPQQVGKCRLQNINMYPAALALSTAYYDAMLPTNMVPVPQEAGFGNDTTSTSKGCTTPPKSRQNSARPYYWKQPAVEDVYNAQACAALGGFWQAANRNYGYGWACTQSGMAARQILGGSGTILYGNTMFSTDDRKQQLNNIVDFEDCNFCMPGTKEMCWKPLYFNACHNCSLLDMLGLSGSDLLGPIGGLFSGIFGFLRDIFGGFAKYIVIVIIILVIVCCIVPLLKK